MIYYFFAKKSCNIEWLINRVAKSFLRYIPFCHKNIGICRVSLCNWLRSCIVPSFHIRHQKGISQFAMSWEKYKSENSSIGLWLQLCDNLTIVLGFHSTHSANLVRCNALWAHVRLVGIPVVFHIPLTILYSVVHKYPHVPDSHVAMKIKIPYLKWCSWFCFVFCGWVGQHEWDIY